MPGRLRLLPENSESSIAPCQLSSSATPGGCCGRRLRGGRATGVFTAFDPHSRLRAILSSILSSNELSSSANRAGSSIAEIEGNIGDILVGRRLGLPRSTVVAPTGTAEPRFLVTSGTGAAPLALELSSVGTCRLDTPSARRDGRALVGREALRQPSRSARGGCRMNRPPSNGMTADHPCSKSPGTSARVTIR
jgi:hypothetical protein